MEYAPVIIPTLNRHEHFKKCLESLEACTGADCTDVYIALDYPPSEKYVDGWKKNDGYLREKEASNSFRSLTIYRRKTNYFFSGKGNATSAINDLPENVDRYIYSEDDNVFSPNFLEYINKGLEKFKDDNSVLAICGYSHPYDVKYSDNNYFFQNVDFSAWGYGIWRKRREEARKVDQTYLRKKLKSCSNVLNLKRNGLNRLLYGIRCAISSHPIPNNDNTLSIYMALENMKVVMPIVTKVRNEGWDGSGLNCQAGGSIAKTHTDRTIDEECHFEYQGNGMAYYNENKSVFVKSSYDRCSYITFFWQLFKCCVKLMIRRK